MPQRFLRPGITTSDAWNSVSFQAQSFYVRILTLVDDYGRYDGRIPILHSHCFALRPDITPQDSAGFRSELHNAKLIQVYTVGGKDFVQVTKWQERARGPSKFPEPPQDSAADGSGAQRIPASLAIVPSPSHEPEPSAAHAHSESFAEIPSWEEFWAYCQSAHCGLSAEWYARDKFEAAGQDNWKGKSNWRAYARRCLAWWRQDGCPKTPNATTSHRTNQAPSRNAGTYNEGRDITGIKKLVR